MSGGLKLLFRPGKLEEFARLPSQDMKRVWIEYHRAQSQRTLCAVLKPTLWQRLRRRAQKSPLFVIPLPRVVKDVKDDDKGETGTKGQAGYESVLQAFGGGDSDRFVFTALGDYQKLGEGAQPWLDLRYYDDFAADKDVVLMRGDIVQPDRCTVTDAQFLSSFMQAGYLDDDRHALVRQFNHDPQSFDFQRAIESLTASGVPQHAPTVDRE